MYQKCCDVMILIFVSLSFSSYWLNFYMECLLFSVYYTMSMVDESNMSKENGWNNAGENLSTLRKTCPSATESTTNHTRLAWNRNITFADSGPRSVKVALLVVKTALGQVCLLVISVFRRSTSSPYSHSSIVT